MHATTKLGKKVSDTAIKYRDDAISRMAAMDPFRKSQKPEIVEGRK